MSLNTIVNLTKKEFFKLTTKQSVVQFTAACRNAKLIEDSIMCVTIEEIEPLSRKLIDLYESQLIETHEDQMCDAINTWRQNKEIERRNNELKKKIEFIKMWSSINTDDALRLLLYIHTEEESISSKDIFGWTRYNISLSQKQIDTAILLYEIYSNDCFKNYSRFKFAVMNAKESIE